ncbi:response regulator transcription factor [Clostridium thermarum]|uniref:response regulator transcription factor n=1 Tax=Clostridium thermarum TaxID=1716543 RepID=UPI0013D2BEC0|nr:response regulator [Clostridium thermarum]
MIKLLIVDDEKMIREGLVNTMPWKEMGIEVVGSAGNGLTALEIVREKKPHIVLTDIRMPKMNGIELLQSIRKEGYKIKVVILSGYDEFAYAQQAIRHGAEDYILKPVNAEELQKVIKRLENELKGEINEDLSHIQLRKDIEVEIEKYVAAVQGRDKATAISILDAITENLTLQKVSTEQIHRLYFEIVESVIHAMEKSGLKINDELREEYLNSFIELLNFTKQQELKTWINDFTENLVGFAEDKKGDSYRLVIKKAVEYMEEHFNEKLSVQKVAEVVYLSPNYFSHIFKKIKKESFTDYLNRIRIEKAKELLSKHLYKVYEVSDMVGYSDYKYFSSVFKKLVGVSPTQYSEL